MCRGLSLAVVVLVGLSQLMGADPVADEFLPFRSVQVVRDLAEFQILKLNSEKTGAWIVARVHSGSSLYIQGAYIKAETGEFVDNGVRPQSVVQVAGEWELIHLLSGEAPRKGRFQWNEPYVNHDFDRTFSIYDGVSGSSRLNGIVICQIFPDKSGAERLSSTTAIPDDWKNFVQPACEFHVEHRLDLADTNLNELRNLAAGQNPFIALTAIRHLLSRTATEEENDQFVDLARSLPKFRQAVLTFWLLKTGDDKARDIVLKIISRSKTAAELPGLALGIESWTATQGRIAPSGATNLRDKVIHKWRSFDSSPASADPWRSWQKILFSPGIQEDKSNQMNE